LRRSRHACNASALRSIPDPPHPYDQKRRDQSALARISTGHAMICPTSQICLHSASLEPLRAEKSPARKLRFTQRFQADLGRPVPPRKNIPLVPSGKSALSARAISSPRRGGSRSSRTRDGMRWTRQRRARKACSQGGLSVSEQRRAGRTALLPPSLKLRRKGTRPGEAFWRGRVAYGKTVWSWHPLLVSSRRRFSQARPGLAKPLIRR
jgi:hypothetical protein